MFKFRKHEFNLREYNRLIRSVKFEEQKIRNWISRIDRRIHELASKMELYRSKNQNVLAGIYAKEINNLAILKDVLTYVNLKFLAACERLDTLRIVLTATIGLKPVLKSLDRVSPVIRLLPEDAEDVFKQLLTSYTELVHLVNPPNAQIKFDLESPEASKILEEVESRVEAEILEKFPNVPVDRFNGKLTDKMGELIEVFAADGGVTLRHRRPRKLTLKDKALRYFKARGRVDVYACARYLNTSPNKVVEMIYELAEEGKLKFKS